LRVHVGFLNVNVLSNTHRTIDCLLAAQLTC